ncbi:hypothetical protein Tco_0600695 [Tanacetum coccineum]
MQGTSLTKQDESASYPGLPDVKALQNSHHPQAAYQADVIRNAYDSDCDEHKSSKSCSHGQSLKEWLNHSPDDTIKII